MIEVEAEEFGSLAESFLPKFEVKLKFVVTGHTSLYVVGTWYFSG